MIADTAFTTVTISRDFPTAVHRDRGDLAAEFGVMAAVRAGEFGGCYLGFPKFRVAVDRRTTDVLLADVHEAHGNTDLVGTPEPTPGSRSCCTTGRTCGTAAPPPAGRPLELATGTSRRPGSFTGGAGPPNRYDDRRPEG